MRRLWPFPVSASHRASTCRYLATSGPVQERRVDHIVGEGVSQFAVLRIRLSSPFQSRRQAGLALAAWRPPLHDGCVQELSAGTLLGHYRVTRRLGRGGMGVYMRPKTRSSGGLSPSRYCRSDTLRPSGAGTFWREARAASSLNHPGICTIHELNESAISPSS